MEDNQCAVGLAAAKEIIGKIMLNSEMNNHPDSLARGTEFQ